MSKKPAKPTSYPEFLKDLLEAKSPTGHEFAAQKVIDDHVEKSADKYSKDALGNRIAELNYGNAKRNPLAQTRQWQFNELSFTDDDEANQLIEPGTRRQDCGQITDGACAIVVATRVPNLTPATLRHLLAVHEEVVHATIEIHHEPNV